MGSRETREGRWCPGRAAAWVWAAASKGNLRVHEHGKGIRCQRARRVVAAAENAHLKTSPNLSATRIVRPERVTTICDGFFGISLRVVIVRVSWKERERNVAAHRSLKSRRLSSAQTLSRLSSPAVARCAYSASTVAQRTGPAFSNPSNSAPSRETVERSSSPVLRINSRQVSEGS
jgi:hypothetical protein